MPENVFKGWKAKILINGNEIGNCDAVSLEITTGVEPYYGIGSREPVTLVEGNEEITGTMSKVWVNKTYLNLCTGATGLTFFDLIFKAGEAAGSPWVYVYDCKFETGSLDIPQDGFLTEDYDFRAMSIFTYIVP